MNAPINLALLQAAAVPLAVTPTTAISQPLIPADARPLHSGYEHDGLLVDLYGELDANGYDVQHVGLYRSVDMTDIGAWLKREVLLQMSDWCNRRLPSAHELRMVSVDEVRIERHEWERNSEPP